MRRLSPRTRESIVRRAWLMPDSEVQTMFRMLHQPKVPNEVRQQLLECIRLRHEMVMAGLNRVEARYQHQIQMLDPLLRIRWEVPFQCHVIERIDTGLRAWLTIFRWAYPDGTAKPLNHAAVTEMVAKLRRGDMQRYGNAKEVLAAKRKKAEQIKKANWNKGVDELMAVIDSMPKKAIKEYVEAEKAIASGEKIHVRGADADKMNKWYEMTRTGQSQISPMDTSVNPGMKPGEYQRQSQRQREESGQ